MSNYPSPPHLEYPVIQTHGTKSAQLEEDLRTNNAISPELPSKWWPWLIASLTVGALGLQSWALVEILGVDKRQAEFDARVNAWEAGDGDRQKTIEARRETLASLRQIQDDVGANVERLRKQTSELEGSMESLRQQRDQLAKESESEKAILDTLSERKTLVSQDLESATLAIQNLTSDRSRIENENAAAEQKHAQLLRTISLDEERLKTLSTQVESQKKLVDSQARKLADAEGQIKTLEDFLSNRKADVAKLENEIQQQKSIQADIELSNSKLAELKSQIAVTESELNSLKTDLANSSQKQIAKESEVTALQKRLADLRREQDEEVAVHQKQLSDLRNQEKEIAARMDEVTNSMSSMSAQAVKMTTEAAQTLVQLTNAAADVAAAIKNLEAARTLPPEPADGQGNAETVPPDSADNGENK